MKEIEFCIHPSTLPQKNMDIDHERALAVQQGLLPPMLRFYSWHPLAVSLGAHQRMSDIDLSACQRLGFDLVRRPTGGRAVLHACELTYSFIVPLATTFNPKRTVHDVYRDAHYILLHGLRSLGAYNLEYQKSQTDFRLLYRTKDVISAPCFSSSARYEIMFNNRKLVGSAQKLYGDVVLQHGSILLAPGHERLADVLSVSSESQREAIKNSLTNQSITLMELIGRSISFEECARALCTAFELDYPPNAM